MTHLKRPSPALVISIMALVAAIAVPAFALNKSEKKVVKKLANAQITKRAPGLAVATANSANTAANADKLDGQDASDFTPADEVHNSGRVVLNDPTPGDFQSVESDLFAAGAFTVQARCEENAAGGSADLAQVGVEAPSGSSISGFSGGDFGFVDGAVFSFNSALSSGNVVNGGYAILVAPSGQVISVTESAEVNDPDGDCVFGVTAVGP